MTEPAQGSEPIRVPDHDLDDLVSTVARLVTESRKQGETLARLTDDIPPSDEDESDGAQHGDDEGSVAASAAAEPGGSQEGPASIFIMALAGDAYVEELVALTSWVHDLLLPVYGREITTGRPWCQQWQEHPEAVARLHALWLAWQQLTDVEAGLIGPSTWHRDHLDPTLLQLRAADGPFGARRPPPAWPTPALCSATNSRSRSETAVPHAYALCLPRCRLRWTSGGPQPHARVPTEVASSAVLPQRPQPRVVPVPSCRSAPRTTGVLRRHAHDESRRWLPSAPCRFSLGSPAAPAAKANSSMLS